MKFSNMPVSPYVMARVFLVDGKQELSEGAVTLRRSQFPGEFDLFRKGVQFTVSPRHRGDTDKLDFALSTGRAIIAWLEDVATDGSAELRVALFNGEIAEMGVVDVGLDDSAVQAVARAFAIHRASVDQLIPLMTEACALAVGPEDNDVYFLFTSGAALEEDLEAEDSSSQDRESAPEPTTFYIHGDGVRFAVGKRQKSRDEQVFVASGITKPRTGQPSRGLRLARGRLSFSDFTRTGQIRDLAAGQMEKLLSQESSYLRKWDEYGAAEGMVLLARARAIGMIRYTKVEPCAQGMTLFLDRPVPEKLAVKDELEITKSVPAYLADPSMEWETFRRSIQEQMAEERGRRPILPRQGEDGSADHSSEVANVVELSEQSITVDLRTPLPEPSEGFFFLFSMRGERTQIQRRMEARRRVVEGSSANPILGMIIEEGADVPKGAKPPKIPALSAFVKRKIFPRNPPTESQERAIRAALNTPDIALIQGPPGTGKTTVIAAILERLNEMSDKRADIRGRVLLTGFQHDAVENLMRRLAINSLPVPKYGGRGGKDAAAAADLTGERIRQWCETIASNLRAKNPALALSEREMSLLLLCRQYGFAPSLEHAIHMLDEALRLPRNIIGEQLAHRVRDLRGILDTEIRVDDGQGTETLQVAQGLRTEPGAFHDDGPERAADVLAACSGALADKDEAVLKAAVCWRGAEPPSFLHDLKQVKLRLLERFAPRPVFRVRKARQDVLQLMGEVMAQVRQRGITATDRTAFVLAEFLAVMEGDPSAIQQAVGDYSYAFAATCQQSVGTKIRNAKERTPGAGKDEPLHYDTVIVDEAARVGPRDLLIPMAQAERRIILVGDHRQLPHVIDEEVARSLDFQESGVGEDEASSENDLIQQSMFQYLFRRLQALEAKDGIPRRVTLKEQFRMHPLLGDFVSDNFYAPYPDEAFKSPLGAEHFAHSLPGTDNVAAIWLNVPASSGRDLRSGTSWTRAAEAQRIASQLNQWIDSPEGAKLSFGIITFYKAQTDLIKAALSAHGYTSRAADGSFEIAKEYAYFRPRDNRLPEERLRIGTVDAFQGMEFDVVFLSMVRSRPQLPGLAKDLQAIEKQGRGIFGHLMSANRLCVGMSRQKRLLLVAGDPHMVTNPIARRCVPGLANFHRLCASPAGRVL